METIQEQLNELRKQWKEARDRGDKITMYKIECRIQLPPFNIKLKRDIVKEAQDIFLS